MVVIKELGVKTLQTLGSQMAASDSAEIGLDGMAASFKNEGNDFDTKTSFFPHFPTCCLAVVFLAVTMAPWHRPLEFLLTGSPLDQQDLSDIIFYQTKCYALCHGLSSC